MPETEVERFIEGVKEPLAQGVRQLREEILASSPRVTESIKWNAPNFRYDGEDRVTFRFPPAGGAQLIFHRGAKVRADAADFVFVDDSGLLTMITPDRGVVTLEQDAEGRILSVSEVAALAARWMAA